MTSPSLAYLKHKVQIKMELDNKTCTCIGSVIKNLKTSSPSTLYSKLQFLSNRKHTAFPSQNKPVNAIYGNIAVYV